jgi:hypothetical protein
MRGIFEKKFFFQSGNKKKRRTLKYGAQSPQMAALLLFGRQKMPEEG